MREADREKFRKRLLKLKADPPKLIEVCLEEHEARVDAESQLKEVHREEEQLFKTYQDIVKQRNDLFQKVTTLERTVVNLSTQLGERNRDCFGRSTETSYALGSAVLEDDADPLSEDAPAEGLPLPRNFESAANLLSECLPGKGDEGGNGGGNKGDCGGKNKKGGNKRPGMREAYLNRLPHHNDFDYNIELLNAMYGENGWTVVGFHKMRFVEHIPETRYVWVVYRPVIRLSNGILIPPEMPAKLYPHSFLTNSLLADVFTKKYDLFIPVYRMLHNTGLGDLGITDTTVYNWLIHFASLYLKPVVNYLKLLMMAVPYHQCDETYWTVIRDGRNPGSKSFMWVHATSELWAGPRMIIVEFEKTRGTDHLREFYRFFKGNIGSDAFAAYALLEKENPDMISISGCMMHVRRRFFFALLILLKATDSEDVVANSTEAQALQKISEIYAAENQLKTLPANERLRRRQIEVRPLMDSFYSFLQGVDLNDPVLSDKMKDAVSYALNHEREVRRFLDDGNIAIDNGHCERAIKPVALDRRNCLFSTSIEGAQTSAIGHSLVETARANGAIPYFYFKYIFENMPIYLAGNSGFTLDDFTPWSDKYKTYEAAERMKIPCFSFSTPIADPWEAWKERLKHCNCA